MAEDIHFVKECQEKSCFRSTLHSKFSDTKEDDNVLTNGLIKSAKRSGQLSLSNRGLGTVPENVWKIDELVLEETKDVDFNRSDSSSWWNSECLKTLDLSSNAINKISPNVKLLQSLVTLKLHDNAISELPVEIGLLKMLCNLSLDRNKLSQLPKEFYQLSDLRVLSISNNVLKSIAPDFGDLVMLTYLDLSHNNLKCLPPGMGYLVRLIEINLSYNQLEELPPDIVNMRDLKKMNISNNRLTSLPPLSELRRMQVLEASSNEVARLPELSGCTALRELHMPSNCIKEITEDFCDQMQQLSVLNLRDNKIEILPENISLLMNLKRLDLTNNSLNKLPKNLGLLSQLQSLSMDGNKLAGVRRDVLRGGADRMIRFLRERAADEAVSEARYTEDHWPDKFTLKKTLALMLPGRELTEVPEHVFAAAADAQVHIVDLSKNKLTTMPSGVTLTAAALTQLVLHSNSLSFLPGELGSLASLQLLDVAGNSLTALPAELGRLQRLRELVLTNNKFRSIPPCVYELEGLEILLAADNQVAELDVAPRALGRLRRLAVLDLTNNSIRRVPPELGTFTHLRSLEIMGNVFRQPRHAVLEKGTASILSYLRDRMPTS